MKKAKSALLSAFVVLFAVAFSFSQQTKELPSASSTVSFLQKITSQAAVGLGLPAGFQFSERLPGSSPRSARFPSGLEDRAASPAPGKDISPEFSDRGRVQGILKLISDIYNERPLPFSQDGTTFTNREGLLPVKPNGFYKEYTFIAPPNSPTVITIGGKRYQIGPVIGVRGAERLVIGGGEIIYYSPDHYKTFVQLEMVY